MTDGGDTKDDVKIPDNEIGDKIKKMFQEEEKDVSKYISISTPNAGSHQLTEPRRRYSYCHG